MLQLTQDKAAKISSIGRVCLIVLLTPPGLNACSHEALYKNIQQNGPRACEERPVFQQASYKAQYQKDYETYKRERDALKEERP